MLLKLFWLIFALLQFSVPKKIPKRESSWRWIKWKFLVQEEAKKKSHFSNQTRSKKICVSLQENFATSQEISIWANSESGRNYSRHLSRSRWLLAWGETLLLSKMDCSNCYSFICLCDIARASVSYPILHNLATPTHTLLLWKINFRLIWIILRPFWCFLCLLFLSQNYSNVCDLSRIIFHF